LDPKVTLVKDVKLPSGNLVLSHIALKCLGERLSNKPLLQIIWPTQVLYESKLGLIMNLYSEPSIHLDYSLGKSY